MKPRIVSWSEAARRLASGEVGVMPSDTVYGIMASALKPAAVERIFELRQREQDKALIVLLAEARELGQFGAQVSERTRELFARVWPGPVSIIVPVASPAWRHIHRGLESIAFRVPAKPELRTLLAEVGPVVAPSANLAGEQPARTVEEAFEYFGDRVFYVDEGRRDGSPSALVDARLEPPKVLRPAPGGQI